MKLPQVVKKTFKSITSKESVRSLVLAAATMFGGIVSLGHTNDASANIRSEASKQAIPQVIVLQPVICNDRSDNEQLAWHYSHQSHSSHSSHSSHYSSRY